jgi:hypothetical protein
VSPYLLDLGDLVRATVLATNVKGDSLVSSIGTGATIITKSDAPINLAENTSDRTATSIGF